MLNFGEELLFKEKDGEKKRVKNIVLFAQDLVIGHRTEKYSVTHILN